MTQKPHSPIPTPVSSSNPNASEQFKKLLVERGLVLASILVDCLFIAFWVIGVWLTDKYVIVPLTLKGVDKVTLELFQWTSGAATFITLLIYTVRDLWILIVRTWREVRRETKNATKKTP
jgi:hypothetical protein